MAQVVRGEATAVQLAAFLVALRAKGETAAEVAGAADALLAHSTEVTVVGPTLDIVGTGGDGTGVVNIPRWRRSSWPRPGSPLSSTAGGRRRRSRPVPVT